MCPTTANKWWLAAAMALSLLGCDRAKIEGTPMTATTAITEPEWQALTQKRVFFGHQSVGYNILDGVRDLAAANPQVRLRVVAVKGKQDYMQPTLGHAEVGHNTNPKSKIDDFAKFLDSGIGDQADVAVLKFCYVDVDDSTDIAKLFEEYEHAIAHLRTRYPKARIAHITMPLMAKQEGIKIWAKDTVKRILGRPVRNVSLNAKRQGFNEMLIRDYGTRDPIFDLAKIESTAPNGDRVITSSNGLTFYSLSPDYTDDGGHLNARGRIIVATEFIRFLASLPVN